MLDQFRGCLLGLAIGDALGAPLEGMNAEEIAQKHGTVKDMIGGGWLELKPGQTTDETQLMLCILESYIENQGCDPLNIADRFLQWFQAKPVDVSSLTHEALEIMAQGYHFERAGREAWENAPDGTRQGNGSLGRTAPTGLARYHDHIHLVGESRVISGITHYDERCKLACAALNMAIAHLLLVGVDGLLDELLEFIEPRNTVLGYALRAIPSLQPRELVTGGYTVDTLQSALWTVMYCDEFEEGMILLINRGEDADAIGAVGGALLGARFGLTAIPQRWLRAVEFADRIDHGARRLYEFAQAV